MSSLLLAKLAAFGLGELFAFESHSLFREKMIPSAGADRAGSAKFVLKGFR